ncbi:MAG: hypothetical protein ACI4JN_12710 [Ruminococcus sp.]
MKMLNMRLWLTSSQRRTFELLAYMLLLSAGCTAGTLFMLNEWDNPVCRFCLAYGIPNVSLKGAGLLISSLIWCMGVMLLSVFLGFCGTGQLPLAFLLGFHGFSTGCTLTSLSQNATIRMIPLYALAALYAVAVSYILLLGVRESMRFSCEYIHIYLYGADSSEIRRRLRLYCVRFAVLTVLLFISSLIYTLLSGIIK